MAEPKFLTWQEVLDQMISFLPPQWRANFTGKILKRLMVAFALSMEGLYGLAAQVLRLSIVATSEGSYLRDLVRGWGMRSFDGIAATVVVNFTRYRVTDSPVTIPAGTELATQGGRRFRTDAEVVLQGGQASIGVACTCVAPGEAGNVGAGRIISLITPIDGIDEVRNPDRAVGGVETEPDGELRARVPVHLALLHRATVPATRGAIASDKRRFPEVVTFTTERQAGFPGYFRGVLADASGGDRYRPGPWLPAQGLPGVWYAVVDFPEVMGLVEAGWPCRRFGEVRRDETGKEIWAASESVAAVAESQYRWFHEVATGRLWANGDSTDLNTLPLTLLADVTWRALVELEDNWAAAGVQVDVITPFVQRVSVTLNYILQPGAVEAEVNAALQNRVVDYVGLLGAGEALGLDGLYGALAGVAGAGVVEILTPDQTVTVGADSIIRAGTVTVERRG